MELLALRWQATLSLQRQDSAIHARVEVAPATPDLLEAAAEDLELYSWFVRLSAHTSEEEWIRWQWGSCDDANLADNLPGVSDLWIAPGVEPTEWRVDFEIQTTDRSGSKSTLRLS